MSSDAFRSVHFSGNVPDTLAAVADRLRIPPNEVMQLAVALLKWYADNRDNEIYVKKSGQFFRVQLPEV